MRRLRVLCGVGLRDVIGVPRLRGGSRRSRLGGLIHGTRRPACVCPGAALTLRPTTRWSPLSRSCSRRRMSEVTLIFDPSGRTSMGVLRSGRRASTTSRRQRRRRFFARRSRGASPWPTKRRRKAKRTAGLSVRTRLRVCGAREPCPCAVPRLLLQKRRDHDRAVSTSRGGGVDLELAHRRTRDAHDQARAAGAPAVRARQHRRRPSLPRAQSQRRTA